MSQDRSPADPRAARAARTVALEAGLMLVAAAADALASADRTDPSLVLVDVLIPDATTGLGLVAAPVQRPGCVVVAMGARGGLRDAALAAGAAAFVEESGDIDAVLDAVRAAAPQHRA